MTDCCVACTLEIRDYQERVHIKKGICHALCRDLATLAIKAASPESKEFLVNNPFFAIFFCRDDE